MAIITVRPGGINAGEPGPGGSSFNRGEVMGWSRKSAARNAQFLQGVDTTRLPDPFQAVCYTLTMPFAPPSAAIFSTMISTLRKAMFRRGVILDHWVIEWTKRGIPHLHGLLVYSPDMLIFVVSEVRDIWLSICKKRRIPANWKGQHCEAVQCLRAWCLYVAKHAGRGARHYQRQRDTLPDGWKKTGRMWGKSLDWPLSEEKGIVNIFVFHQFRRMVRRYLVAESKTKLSQSRDPKKRKFYKSQLVFRRRMLVNNDRGTSTVRGLAEWIDHSVAWMLIDAALKASERRMSPLAKSAMPKGPRPVASDKRRYLK
jgi:hypothetical protein